MNRPNHRLRRPLASLAALAATATTGGLFTACSPESDLQTRPASLSSNGAPTDSSGGDVGRAPERRTAQVMRRDLQFTFNMWGVLGRTGLRTVGGGDGIVTALPAPGTLIDEGDALYGVDGHDGPVLLEGALPMWRSISAGISDGPDIEQLEAGLARLGYSASTLVIDRQFTDATRLIIEDFQRARGVAVTGALGPDDIWFSPGPVRVATLSTTLGRPATSDVLNVTDIDQTIEVGLDPRQIQYVAAGDAVTLSLPDGASAAAVVARVAETATVTRDNNGVPISQTISVSITPQDRLDVADGSSVIVRFLTVTANDVLAVPSDAIVATSDHRFALEVVAPDGTTTLVEVTLGQNADGWVEVAGDIVDGSTVVTA